MSVAVYLRVSTTSQTVDSQEVAISNYLKSQGYDCWETYKDVISGVKTERPGLKRLLEDVNSGKITVLYVYSLNRISRSLIQLLQLLQNFEQSGVGLVSITEALDFRTPSGRMVASILGSLGAFERELIIQRVRSGLQAAKQRGKVLGRKRTRNSELIRSLYAQGLSYRKIASIAKCSLATVQAEIKCMEKEGIVYKVP